MAQIIKKGPSYMVRVTWRDVDGKQHKKSKSGFKTKAAARKAAAEMESLKYDGKLSANDPYIADYFSDWVKLYKSSRATNATMHQYDYTAKVLDNYFHRRPISKITRTEYQRFLNDFGRTHSHETMRKLHIYISKCATMAVDNGIIPKSFTSGAEVTWNPDRTRKIDYLNMAEISKLISLLKEKRSPQYVARYMIITAAYTGMRLAEIGGLTWSDLNVKYWTININKSWDYSSHTFKATKTKGSNRIIKINPELGQLLLELKANGSDMIFESPRSRTIPTSTAVNKTLRKFMKKGCIDKPSFNFHGLRHSHVGIFTCYRRTTLRNQ